ncbi:nuclear transport factor 2 family protein, partial [Rhodohalobacter sulfatireducens]|uniref:nuclear transport factor 2 family protein n=1 Tax=Rhodohalobacter sulfatireducens TaxID=2911366 RepID=UPI00272AACCA
MKKPIKHIEEARKVYDLFWDSYLVGDIDTFAATLDENFEMIGTSESEHCHNKAEGIEFIKAQKEELIGSVEMRNREVTELPIGNVMLINEFCDLYVLSETDWSFYSKFRSSAMLRETEDGWKMAQQHGSLPDMRVGEGETLAIEKITKENIELRDAVKRRTAELEHKNRELEIEAALERVRARSMAMHKSEELVEVVRQLKKEIMELGIDIDVTQIVIDFTDDPHDGLNDWVSVEGQRYLQKFHIPFIDHPITTKFYETLENDLGSFTVKYSKPEKNAYFKLLFEHSDFKDIPEERKNFILEAPGWVNCVVIKNNCSMQFARYRLEEFNHEEKDLFKRFTSVFGQAYTRFLDLQKAEEQTREAQIEASLERIRSRTMAMHQSEELQEVVAMLYQEFKHLVIAEDNIDIEVCIINEATGAAEVWQTAFSFTGKQVMLRLPFTEIFPLNEEYIRWRETKPEKRHELLIVNEYSGSIFEKFLQKLASLHGWEHVIRQFRDNHIKQWFTHNAYFSHGMLTYQGVEQTGEENLKLLQRFAKIFEQTYARFLDLQKAEAQALEAQIEAALERVRAQSMGMQQSEELINVVQQIGRELKEMGIEVHNSQIWTDISVDPNASINIWLHVEGQSYLEKFHFPLSDHPIDSELIEAIEKDLPLFSSTYSKSEIASYFKYAFNETELKRIPQERKDIILNAPGWTRCTVLLNEACLQLSRFNLDKFTEDEQDIFKRLGKVFEQAYTRFLDLQKAEKQAREAQIEAALERIRSRSMGMQKSEEINEVLAKMFEEFTSLRVDLERVVIWIYHPEGRSVTWWAANPEAESGTESFHIADNDNPVYNDYWKLWEERKSKHYYELSGEAKNSWDDHLFSETGLWNLPEEVEMGMREPDPIHLYNSFQDFGAFFVASVEYLDDAAFSLIERFAKVFQQAWTRFNDIKQAEEQAREAQIEAALERIRSRSMGMQSSDELSEVVQVIYNEVEKLGISNWGCKVIVIDEDENQQIWYSDYSNEEHPKPYDIDNQHHALIRKTLQFWKSDEEFLSIHLKDEEKFDFNNFLFEKTGMKNLPKQVKKAITGVNEVFFEYANTKHGFVQFIDTDPFPEKVFPTLKRIAQTFEQAYTRFLDVKRAEDQAREAKIEAALERVRSRSMGIQKSDELGDVATLLYEEMRKLGITDFITCGYQEMDEETQLQHCWMTRLDGSPQEKFVIPLKGDPILDERYNKWKNRVELFCQEAADQELANHIAVVTPAVDVEEVKEITNKLPNPTYFYCGNFEYGYMTLVTGTKLTEEQEDLFVRFTRIFKQAYIRFKDLQKAEKLALETARQSSLDRIRAEIASMRSAEDLNQITPIIWDELKTLEIPFIRCGVFIIDEENGVSHTYLSTSQGEPIAALHLPLTEFPLVENSMSSWKNKEIYTVHWDEQDFRDWSQSLIEGGFIQSKKKYSAGSVPKTLDLHFLPFKHGMLYIGNTEPLSQEHLDLGQSLASAFSVAYDRYEDFNKLEQAKQKIEEAFEELEAAKDQLVQQEKLASLGQLTAGIAHEIKNPLNFVNNFSDLSIELVEEARDEVRRVTGDRGPKNSPLEGSAEAERRRGVSDEATNHGLILEILNDIETNLKTIHKHGTRADGIVKSMLQHSRGGSGKMEATNINALIKEYSNLAFHGMRAGKDPINVDIELDLDKNVGEVEMITEDFSRV